MLLGSFYGTRHCCPFLRLILSLSITGCECFNGITNEGYRRMSRWNIPHSVIKRRFNQHLAKRNWKCPSCYEIKRLPMLSSQSSVSFIFVDIVHAHGTYDRDSFCRETSMHQFLFKRFASKHAFLEVLFPENVILIFHCPYSKTLDGRKHLQMDYSTFDLQLQNSYFQTARFL